MKRAVTIVAEQSVSVKVRDVEVGPAVVVVVGGRRSHTEKAVLDARLIRDVDEPQVPFVPIQPIPVLRPGFVGTPIRRHWVAQTGSVYQINVQPPVVVVVKERKAPNHGLDQILLDCWRLHRLKADARTLGDVFETEGMVGILGVRIISEHGNR